MTTETTTTTIPALLPCPFCGGKAEVREEDSHNRYALYWVGCNGCGCATDTDLRAEEAVSDWNRRAAPSPAPAAPSAAQSEGLWEDQVYGARVCTIRDGVNGVEIKDCRDGTFELTIFDHDEGRSDDMTAYRMKPSDFARMAAATIPAAQPAQPDALPDLVLVPRDLIGSACAAIDAKRDAPNTLAQLRRYTTGDLSAQPAQGGSVSEAAKPQSVSVGDVVKIVGTADWMLDHKGVRYVVCGVAMARQRANGGANPDIIEAWLIEESQMGKWNGGFDGVRVDDLLVVSAARASAPADQEVVQDRVAELEAEIEAWQMASGLCVPPEDKGGDPGGVKPSHLAAHLNELNARLAGYHDNAATFDGPVYSAALRSAGEGK